MSFLSLLVLFFVDNFVELIDFEYVLDANRYVFFYFNRATHSPSDFPSQRVSSSSPTDPARERTARACLHPGYRQGARASRRCRRDRWHSHARVEWRRSHCFFPEVSRWQQATHPCHHRLLLLLLLLLPAMHPDLQRREGCVHPPRPGRRRRTPREASCRKGRLFPHL